MDTPEIDFTALRTNQALYSLMDSDLKKAEEWLRKIPRAERGRVRIALEDLSMMIERLGN